jgi:murein DD-endopeptidase MepM/ murein hydrolase activator NlpD/urea transporter
VKELKILCKAYSSIFFIESVVLGLILAIATFCYPNIGFSGLVALLFAQLISMGLKIHQSASYSKTLLYNSLLVGLFIGHLYRFSALSILLIAIAIVLTIMLTTVLDAFFKNYGLPVLSLPFVAVSIVIALVATKFDGLRDATPYFIERGAFLEAYLPGKILHFFRSLGSIFCITDALFGGVIFLAVFLKSPLMALFLSAGFYIGFEAEMIFKSDLPPSMDAHFFNYSLIFACLSSVFLFPSFKSLITASIATLVASVIVIASLVFWDVHQVPITALPFNLIVIMVIQALISINPLLLYFGYTKTPEETIDRARISQLRHATGEVGIFCPFDDTWLVQQGFDGEWTHKGPWKHALDFVKTGSDHLTYINNGYELTDYHAFSKPVLSPMDGYVVGVQSAIQDNRIGTVDNQNNWGNYLIIRSYGVYAILAHLKKDSILVSLGDYVTAGHPLATCGNSGYSKEPHLHLQIQYGPLMGAHTIPFHLLNYSSNQNIYFQDIPKQGDIIGPLLKNGELDRALTFKIGEQLKFNLRTKDCTNNIDKSQSEEVIIETLLNEITGSIYLSDNSGTRLYFNKIGTQFYFYGLEGKSSSPLADLFMVAPRIPIAYGESLNYNDHLPLFLTDNFIRRWIKVVTMLLIPKAKHWASSYYFNSRSLEISGNTSVKGTPSKTALKLDPVLGIMNFSIGDRSYERVR